MSNKNKEPKYKIGMKIIPNEYLIKNKKPLFGIILDQKDGILDHFIYKVVLSNLVEKWINESDLENLFEIDYD